MEGRLIPSAAEYGSRAAQKESPGFLGREAGAGASASNGQLQTVTRRQRGPTGVSTRRLTT